MAGQTRQLAHPGQRRVLARMSCLGLGVALLLWSLAPAVVERILTREAPRAQTLVLSSLTFLVGFAFLGLHALIGRGLRWALWVTFVLALAIATAGVAATIALPASMPGLFSLILAAATATTTWLALDEKRGDELAKWK